MLSLTMFPILPKKAVSVLRTNMKISHAFALSVALVGLPCAVYADDKVEKKMESAPQIVDTVELIAVLQPTKGNSASGIVNFRTLPDGKVQVSGRIAGLTPGSEHGFHIHQYGDERSADGSSLGDHYDPLHFDHAMPTTANRHAGDLGNIKADEQGVAEFEIIVDNISLSGQKSPIIGRGIVVHAKPDDGGQPSGNAGDRIAVGVIGVRNLEIK